MNCNRCTRPITRASKTGLCQACAARFVARKNPARRAALASAAQRGGATMKARQQERYEARNYSEPSLPKLKFLEGEE